jgi:hypothetical protein
MDWIKRLQEEGDEFEDTLPDEEEYSKPPSNVSQHTLLSYISLNYDLWTIIEPIIKSEYFDEEYKLVVDLLKEHSFNYKQVPSLAIIKMKTGITLENFPDANDERTREWLLDEVQTFCRHRAIEAEIKRASLAIRKDAGRKTLEQILENVKNIVEISLEKDLGLEIHRDAREILNTKEQEEIKPTNYKILDRLCGNGLPSPGLILFAGTSGLGKSVTLANFGVNYCEQGEFVVYISLELPQKRIFQRVCSMISGVNIRNIYNDKDRISGLMESRIEMGNDGLFFIKKLGMSGTTISHIAAYLKELRIKTGRKPKILILDYLDLLHPRTPIRDLGNLHVKDKYTAEETYALCEEWEMIGLTASQMVKNNSEIDDFDHSIIGGGTPKINTMDYVFGLRRKDEELIMRIMKGRYGGEGTQIPFHWNKDTLRITSKSDEEFYDLNPRYDPNLQRKNATKSAGLQKSMVNKDVRNIHKDDVLSKIKNMDPNFGE